MNDPTIDVAISHFLESKRLDQGASSATLSAYRQDLKQFSEGFAHQTISHFSSDAVESFLRQSQTRSLSARSLARKISSLRQFFKFCYSEYGLEPVSLEKLSHPKIEKNLPKFLELEEIEKLLSTTHTGLPYPNTPLGGALRQRDEVMLMLLYACGLRVSELVNLKLENIDLKGGFLKVTGKGNKQRLIPFPKKVGELLENYFKEGRAVISDKAQKKETETFLGMRGEGITRQAFWKTLKELALQAGLKKLPSPHVLRHTFATHLLQSGMNLRTLQMLLGHSDLSTTEIYTHVAPEHLKKAHEKFHPRG